MTARGRSATRAPAWLAAALPPAAWFAFEQGLGTVVRLACVSGGPPVGPLVGLGALLACGVAATLAWRNARTPATEAQERGRRVTGLIGLGAAGLFGLTILLQTLATLIVPPCVR